MKACLETSEHCQTAKVISCVMARGHGEFVVQALYQQKHILGIDYATGRNQNLPMGVKEWQEVDMLTAIVSPEYADEVFYEMYHLAKVGETEGGMIFQTEQVISTDFTLPDLTELVPEEVSLEKDVPDSEEK